MKIYLIRVLPNSPTLLAFLSTLHASVVHYYFVDIEVSSGPFRLALPSHYLYPESNAVRTSDMKIP